MKLNRTWAMVVAIVMALTLSLGSTLAYLSDTDSDVNVMVLGNVQIEQHEQERVTDDDGNTTTDADGNTVLQDFTNYPVIYPLVGDDGAKESLTVNGYTVDHARDLSKAHNYIDKIVTVENTGKSDAYVRTIFAFPEAGNPTEGGGGFNTTWNSSNQWLHWNGVSDVDTDNGNGWIWSSKKYYDEKIASENTEGYDWPGNTNNWNVVENVLINGKYYDLYVVTNINKLAPKAKTAPSLLGFYLDSAVDNEVDGAGNVTYTWTDNENKVWNLGDISQIEILVATQAVQADGFEDAWTALEEAFDTISATNHPWLNVSTAASYTTAGTYNLDTTIILPENTEETDAVVAAGENVIVNINGGYYDASNQDCTVWAYGSAVINIYDGYFVNDNEYVSSDGERKRVDMIYAGENGTINIHGGFFTATGATEDGEDVWLLNERDKSGEITVYGGTFVNWNPAANAAEGKNTSFLAEGYMVEVTEQDNGDTWYTVVKSDETVEP